jgi:hypothetical protein
MNHSVFSISVKPQEPKSLMQREKIFFVGPGTDTAFGKGENLKSFSQEGCVLKVMEIDYI